MAVELPMGQSFNNQRATDSSCEADSAELESGLLNNEPLQRAADRVVRHEHIIVLVATFFGAAGVALLLAFGVKTLFFRFAGLRWYFIHPVFAIPALYFALLLARAIRAHTGFDRSPLTSGRTVAVTLIAIAGFAWMSAVVTLLNNKGMDFRCVFFFMC